MSSHSIHKHPLVERTLVFAKHDAVQRGLIGEIITRFENRGFKLLGIKMIVPTDKELGMHYPDDINWKRNCGERQKRVSAEKGIPFNEDVIEFGTKVRKWNMDALRGTPLVVMVWEGFHAAEIGRKIVGHTDPSLAVPGTVRGDYTVESFRIADVEQRVVRNVVHASGSKEEAENEIAIWFKPDELVSYDKQVWVQMHTFD
ncbi:MAG: nucleoside-diphosphate kinase [Candidatus Woesearchaeota archaeon]